MIIFRSKFTRLRSYWTSVHFCWMKKGESYSKFSWKGFQPFPYWIRECNISVLFAQFGKMHSNLRSNDLCCLSKVTGRSTDTNDSFFKHNKGWYSKNLTRRQWNPLVIGTYVARCWKRLIYLIFQGFRLKIYYTDWSRISGTSNFVWTNFWRITHFFF